MQKTFTIIIATYKDEIEWTIHVDLDKDESVGQIAQGFADDENAALAAALHYLVDEPASSTVSVVVDEEDLYFQTLGSLIAEKEAAR